MFIGGAGGAAQIIATLAAVADARRYAAVIRHGRYIAFGTAVIGGPLLIADLHTPQRFYNMLRIFRPTSPMSIGTYVLIGFGSLSAVLAAAQARRDQRGSDGVRGTVERLAELSAAALGAGMTTYTGALISATSTPLWAAAPKLIPALFGASAMASGAAALSLGAPAASAAVLDRLLFTASTAQLPMLWALRRELEAHGVATRPAIWPLLLAASVPAAIKVSQTVIGTRKTGGICIAAAAALAGAFLLRHSLLRAGNRSARQPRDHFRLARPR
jgi:formate-dependent nitrite reductase membrane component NrfD